MYLGFLHLSLICSWLRLLP